MSRSVRDDIDKSRERERQARAQQADRIHNERDLSFAAHCEGYGLEWLDEPDERKTP